MNKSLLPALERPAEFAAAKLTAAALMMGLLSTVANAAPAFLSATILMSIFAFCRDPILMTSKLAASITPRLPGGCLRAVSPDLCLRNSAGCIDRGRLNSTCNLLGPKNR